MKQYLFPLLAALLLMMGCSGNKVSYKGFSFEYPANYKLEKNVNADGMRCKLSEEQTGDLFLVEVVPGFRKDWGMENSGNGEVGDFLANAVYDLFNQFFDSDETVTLDRKFQIDSSSDKDQSPYAYAELAGKRGGVPFRAVINSDVWGDNQVTTLILAYSEARYHEMFNGIFGSYAWKE